MNLRSDNHERVAILFNRMGPYHFARLRAAGKVLPTTLLEIFKEDKTYRWSEVTGVDGFERLTLFEREPQPAREVKLRIQTALDSCRPAVVVIPGWSSIVAFSALQWCIANRVPAIVMSESTEWDESRRWWKEWVKRRILGLCAGGLCGGAPHADYLSHLGLPRERIFLGYDAVDNRFFEVKAAEARSRPAEVSGRLGLPEKYFLASARFIEKKNLSRLVKAYARYRELWSRRRSSPADHGVTEAGDPGKPWSLVLLGDGPLMPDLVQLVRDLGLEHCVQLPGFKQYDELPSYYGLASVFIHASTTEQWGLVVNEAMASGLPVLMSRRCGCAQDLVKDGVNGFTFDPYQGEELAELMSRVAEAGFPLADFGTESRRIISAWGPERFGQGLHDAAQAALKCECPRAGLLDRFLLRLLLQS